jgi:tRNA threonylcarbamoyladenosine biosynthesis protein TsaB
VKLLALDTSSVACTVGVADGVHRYLRHAEQARAHTRILMPMIREVLDESGLAPSDLDAIVLGNGPGSFIGMRIAASVAEGLAYGAGLCIVPVSSLAAVALAAGSPGQHVIVAQDAHMNEVYLGIYRCDESGVSPVVDERLHGQQAIAELDELESAIAAGSGWQRYPGLLAANRSKLDTVSECLYPTASALLQLGATALAAGHAIAPQEVAPAYLRHKVAEKPAPPRP